MQMLYEIIIDEAYPVKDFTLQLMLIFRHSSNITSRSASSAWKGDFPPQTSSRTRHLKVRIYHFSIQPQTLSEMIFSYFGINVIFIYTSKHTQILMKQIKKTKHLDKECSFVYLYGTANILIQKSSHLYYWNNKHTTGHFRKLISAFIKEQMYPGHIKKLILYLWNNRMNKWTYQKTGNNKLIPVVKKWQKPSGRSWYPSASFFL